MEAGSAQWCTEKGQKEMGTNCNAGHSTEMWEATFSARVVGRWKRLLRGAVESPSLEILRTQLDTVPEPALADPVLSRVLDETLCRAAFQPPLPCDPVKHFMGEYIYEKAER